MRWYLNPSTLKRAAQVGRRVISGGGPKTVRVKRVEEPEGLIVPTSSVSMEVEARDGTVTRFAPEVPVPWPYAWGYRLARRLELPLVSALDPERVRFELPLLGDTKD
jgi:hypothetical protein